MNLTLQDLMEMSMEDILKFLDGRKFIISISGMDNLGKSTQARMLAEKYPEVFSNPLHINQSPSFPVLKGKELSRWWFDPNNTTNFVRTMYAALAERRQRAMEMDSPIVVMDKGIDFYDERIKATLITLGVPEHEIVELITTTKRDLGLNNSYEDLKIAIVPPQNGQRSFLREEEVEEHKEQSDVYSRYMARNIQLMNRKLQEGKVFVPVEFIEGDVEGIHSTILTELVQNIDIKTQRKTAQAVAAKAKMFFGDNLRLLVLAGSAGKGKFIEDWSDIDMYYFFDEMPYDTIQEYTQLLDGYGVHIGATYYTVRELQDLKIDARTAHVVLELNKGKNKEMFNSGVEIPTIPFNYTKTLDEGDIPDALNVLKRELFNSNASANKDNTRDKKQSDAPVVMPYNTAKIIKTLSLLLKLLLKSSSDKKVMVPDGYLDCFEMFGEIYGEKLLQRQQEYILANDVKNSIRCKQLYDIIRNIDIVELIKDRHTMESCLKMHQYGMAVLKMLDEIGYNNFRMESGSCQREEVVEQL